ncbi:MULTISPECIES: diacylglycerol kinase [Paraburkholderia]|uniref:diacylglycerol kinase n=1 Tax=Paraburkholderia TaxID=1822464 RepID=UPI00224EF48E|nr:MULTISPECIES: diacylglycerol kinase [Paraburkholderia]MCX4165480.1 diacylglycerol kinase [Paraburkholderia megapolitana]MDN7160971.1 diacylglycerol kinase [Paraburkholderia sp. CHISQ3]MDQ6498018.1 diacylglycerol kinase [Paraburkholderia megapolitana]
MRARTSPAQRDTDAAHTASAEPFDDVRDDTHNGTAPADGIARSHVASIRRVTRPDPDHAPATPDTHRTHDGHDPHEHHEPLGPDDPLAPLPFNPYKGNRGVTRAWHALKNSLAGFRVAIREESAFRQELTLAAILLPCGVLVPVEPVSRVLLLGSVLLVLIVELLNSSVEAAIDRISLERHELSRRAKDFGSAAVTVALCICVMTWALLVGPLAWQWIASLM